MKQKDVIKCLKQLEMLYLQDELAYLFLTSKGETIIRDKLAYLLNKQFQCNDELNKNFTDGRSIVVTREWAVPDKKFNEKYKTKKSKNAQAKRVDLVVFQEKEIGDKLLTIWPIEEMVEEMINDAENKHWDKNDLHNLQSSKKLEEFFSGLDLEVAKNCMRKVAQHFDPIMFIEFKISHY